MSELSAHEVLVRARNLIADEKDWVPYAADQGPYCAVSAISRAGDHNGAVWLPANRILGELVGSPCVYPWNDSHSHAEVLAAFDQAIAQTAPRPDLSFLNDVRVEPERVA